MRSCFLLFLVTVTSFSGARGQSYFPIPAVTQAEQFERNISYTASLLTARSAQPAREVRILVYGQSISGQDWWQQVKTFLASRYPAARINMANKAIGGFSADRLKLTVDNDVTTYYPDLILFHDYGGEPDYETIIRTIRRRTTAEIIIQTDHLALGQKNSWIERHNDVWLPELCRKYNLALADIRTAWKTYLADNKLEAKELLSDNVHLNAHGNYLMAGILNNYFQTLPATVTPTFVPVQVLKAGRDFTTGKKLLTLAVTGNRIDLVFDSAAVNQTPILITLDGKKPSECADCYYYTQPTNAPPNQFFLNRIGQLLKMELGTNTQEEAWTLRVIAVDSVQQQLQFSVKSTLTGEDGTGHSAAAFVSRSGKMNIDAKNWFRRRDPGDFAQFRWLQPGDTLNWQVKSRCQDVVKTTRSTVTVVQGVTNGPHTLQLSGKLVGLREIRVYRPPLKE